MTHVHVVYAHPSPSSFTRQVLDTFLGALADAGHTATVSDLYAMGFRPDLTLDEYERESGRRPDTPLPADVAAEHSRLNSADVWAFIYPVWWNDCPALLKGWFDRVWTVGVAYKPTTLRRARKALVLCTSGYTAAEEPERHEAMRVTMLTDRVGSRAAEAEFHLLGGRTSEYGPGHLAHVTKVARSL